MDQQHHAFANAPTPAATFASASIGAATGATRHDGWDAERKARFLVVLCEHGNVRLAAARVGRSVQSVYVQRRRDPLFDRAWKAALIHARDASEQIFAERALEGVEEPVFYKGEQVGTRRRYDNRLLLAHMARLDRMAEDRKAMQDAARFDELLALVAGERFDGAEDGGDPLPPPRERYANDSAEAAAGAATCALPPAHRRNGGDIGAGDIGAGDMGGDPEATEDAQFRAVHEAASDAWAEAAIRWDTWQARAHARADALTGGVGRAAEPASLNPVNFVNFDTDAADAADPSDPDTTARPRHCEGGARSNPEPLHAHALDCRGTCGPSQ